MSVESVKHEVKVWLENTACLGRDALLPRSNCDTTYVEMATNSIMNQINKLLNEKQNEQGQTKIS